MVADDGYPDTKRLLHELYHPSLVGIRKLPKPVVAGVHGPAVGFPHAGPWPV